MTEIQVARQRRNSQIFLILLGVVTTAWSFMSCIWTSLVASASVLIAFVTGISAGGFTAAEAEMARLYNNMAPAFLAGGLALALAPWGVIGFWVLTLLGIWFWHVRKSSARPAGEG